MTGVSWLMLMAVQMRQKSYTGCFNYVNNKHSMVICSVSCLHYIDHTQNNPKIQC